MRLGVETRTSNKYHVGIDGNGNMDLVRYPDSRVEVLDERFAKYKLGTAAVKMLWTGGRWVVGATLQMPARIWWFAFWTVIILASCFRCG